MLWYILIITAVAGIFHDPMWFLVTPLAILIACIPIIFGNRD